MFDLSIWDVGASMAMVGGDVIAVISVAGAFLILLFALGNEYIWYPRPIPYQVFMAGWIGASVGFFMLLSLKQSGSWIEPLGLFFRFSLNTIAVLLLSAMLLLIIVTGMQLRSRFF